MDKYLQISNIENNGLKTDNLVPVASLISEGVVAERLNVLEMFAKQAPILRQRKGSATFTKESVYQPVIPANTAYALQFDTEARKSRDVRIYRHSSGNAFRVGMNGSYSINANWYIEIPEPSAMTFCELQLYVNGSFACSLDREPTISYIPLGGNAEHKELTLQGSKDVDLTISDRFDIRLIHDKALGFGSDEYHGGYLDILLTSTEN